MPVHLETRSIRNPQEVGYKNVAGRLPIVKNFLERRGLEELPSLEKHVIGQAIGHFLLKGKIDSAALHTSAQQNTQPIPDEDSLKRDIGKTISSLEKKGLLVFNEEQNTYSLVQEPSPQNKGRLH